MFGKKTFWETIFGEPVRFRQPLMEPNGITGTETESNRPWPLRILREHEGSWHFGTWHPDAKVPGPGCQGPFGSVLVPLVWFVGDGEVEYFYFSEKAVGVI